MIDNAGNTIEKNNCLLQALVQLQDHNLALLFANYLATLSIETEVVTQQQNYIIYCDQNHLAQAKAEFEAFIKQPYHSKYQQAAWQHGETVKVSRDDLTLLKAFKENFLAHAGIVTLIVFAFCWLVFIGSLLGWAESLFSTLKFYNHLSIDGFLQEPFRLLGPAFFHFSWLHIVFNTMWWWQLGGSIEKTLGKGTLINLLLITAIVSNLGQFLVSGPNFGGLSGVVYGLVGFVWWVGYLAPERGLTISKPIIGFMLFWLLLGFAELLPVNMANTAHLLGLLSGCIFAVLLVKTAKK
ncbi:rhomboid family intramembrane serine protease GlpG [Litorilituus lipolyticus]|uniref:Rhomboid family intramembrane serine protease GlpG n=1 Tax=Litorilituus lipolyticus TaxID=2491017 RepID=A0A502KV80_9GAMM|nr:rhomboid family intramembrane serine protease GlpG [Litorilituus lipolyticus]TPH15620.1 rhomboid family intramembrane serine protease GlpG [Litorilituus lipolyticus]